ncbi:hypothetical protein QA601_16310 [Chitinispirillales bacterium ANBcel5]|uniref:hypothetical protein n=1 Tax=Cellulosispirillum alkaliphilum TaxID=3039283 RepID=UPI002A55AA94|nr:hypothetical protein [Chitinispirillales bacterium ANBcel5]
MISGRHIPRTIKLLCSVLLCLAAAAQGQITATTSDGRSVVLNEDGTWSFAQEETTDKAAELNEESESQPAETASRAEESSSEAPPQSPAATNAFRNAKWLMSPEQVKDSETATLERETENTLVYDVTIHGIKSTLTYMFSDDQLTSIRCNFNYSHSNPNRYYKDFESLKNKLISDYGNPQEDEQNWQNDMYRDNTSRWGFAIGVGFLSCKTQWHTDDASITLTISGANHRANKVLELKYLN